MSSIAGGEENSRKSAVSRNARDDLDSCAGTAKEVAQLREESSSMRRAKLTAETQLEQKKSQLASASDPERM